MKARVISTYKILKQKAFNEDIDEGWINWAIEMMEAGFESDNLYILAGMTKPFNQFELQELTDRVLKDLKLSYSDKEKVTRSNVYFIIKSIINHPEGFLAVLREVKDICIDLDMDEEYMDFYLLYFAKEDLIEFENQWYWNEANRDNIDKIIKERFQNFIDKSEQQDVKNNP